MAGTVDAVTSVGVFVERLATQLTVNAVRVVTTVGAVAPVASRLEQFLVKVALVRLPAAVARCTNTSNSCIALSYVVTKPD